MGRDGARDNDYERQETGRDIPIRRARPTRLSNICNLSNRSKDSQESRSDANIKSGNSRSASVAIGKSRFRFQHLHDRQIPDGGSDADSTAFEIPKYSESDYLFPATDSMGQSARLQCKAQPTIAREIQSVVHSRRFPFRTDSDVIRWCVYTGLAELAKREPSTGFLAKAWAEVEVLRDQQYWSAQQEMMRHLDEAVKRCMQAGQYGEARQLVLKTLANLNSLEKSSWNEQTIEEIRQRHRHIIEYNGQ